MMATTPEQDREVAVGINGVLRSLGYREQELSDWWNLVAFHQLDGLTPTQAWLRGRQGDVERLVRDLHDANVEAAKYDQKDADLMALLRSRLPVTS